MQPRKHVGGWGGEIGRSAGKQGRPRVTKRSQHRHANSDGKQLRAHDDDAPDEKRMLVPAGTFVSLRVTLYVPPPPAGLLRPLRA